MSGQALTARERHALDHLRQAEEFGVSLEYYAKAYDVDLQQLHYNKAQLERKGLWPPKPPAPQAAVSATRAQLLSVRVVSETTTTSEPVEAAQEGETLRFKVTAPNGWMMECDRWPAAQWLSALMGGAG